MITTCTNQPYHGYHPHGAEEDILWLRYVRGRRWQSLAGAGLCGGGTIARDTRRGTRLFIARDMHLHDTIAGDTRRGTRLFIARDTPLHDTLAWDTRRGQGRASPYPARGTRRACREDDTKMTRSPRAGSVHARGPPPHTLLAYP